MSYILPGHSPISPLDWTTALWKNLEEYDRISFPDEPENVESVRWFLHHYFDEDHWDLEVHESFRLWVVPYRMVDEIVVHLICTEKTPDFIRFISVQAGRELILTKQEVLDYRTWCRDERGIKRR